METGSFKAHIGIVVTRRATECVLFSGLIRELRPGEWGAFAWIREPDLSLQQKIGPKILATESGAHQWLTQIAKKQGFENFNIVVERLGDDGLLVESIRPDMVEEEVIAPDVDA